MTDGIAFQDSSLLPSFLVCYWLLRFGKLETDVRPRADAHQSQQCRTELGHGEIVINRRHEHDPEHNRPGENLETMKLVLAPERFQKRVGLRKPARPVEHALVVMYPG